MSQAIETDVILCPPSEGWEQVDPATWKIIQRLFPEQTRGQLFFIRFLERAAREQSQIPDAPATSPYICTQSIATLGQELGFSNDTTQKYVQLYMALGLLRKIKFMDRLAFLLSVGPYQAPETLEANLDHLLAKSRPRLREMTSEVKARCKLYGLISQDFVTALTHLKSFLATTKGNKRTLEQHLGQAQVLISTLLAELVAEHLQDRSLQSHWGDSESREQLLQTNEIGRCAVGTIHTNLPRSFVQGDVQQNSLLRESPSFAQGKRLDMNLLQQTKQGDSKQSTANTESPHIDLPGRLDLEVSNTNLPNQSNQRDSHLPGRNGESPLDRKSGRKLPQTAMRGDSIQERGNGESPQTRRSGRLDFEGEKPRISPRRPIREIRLWPPWQEAPPDRNSGTF